LRIKWARQIADAGYDLLLQDELNHPSLFLLNRLLQSICRTPIIAIVHHLRSSEVHSAYIMPIYRLVERMYLQSVDGFIYNSRTTRHIVERVLGKSLPNVIAYPAANHHIPPAHQSVVGAIATRLQGGGPLQLLFVGNLMARKGLHTVLNALARFGHADWQLHIIGSQEVDPSYSSAMRHRANTLSVNRNLTWYGRASDETLRQLLLKGDLLVMPSYEGFGIVFLEAMAYGLPVLAANVGAAPEIVYPGTNGYLVPFDDDYALSGYLNLLHDNRVQLANLAFHARKRYEEHPSWEESMEAASTWLREISSSV
jgi:glycosyltransferase involved in cell wall biosynthesis